MLAAIASILCLVVASLNTAALLRVHILAARLHWVELAVKPHQRFSARV